MGIFDLQSRRVQAILFELNQRECRSNRSDAIEWRDCEYRGCWLCCAECLPSQRSEGLCLLCLSIDSINRSHRGRKSAFTPHKKHFYKISLYFALPL